MKLLINADSDGGILPLFGLCPREVVEFIKDSCNETKIWLNIVTND
jgi:hypothetical protein